MIDNFSLYQLLVPTFGIIMILRAFSYTGRGRTIREFFTVAAFWIFVSLFAIFPDIFIDRIALFLGIRSGINAIFFFGFVVLFYIVFRLIISQEESEQRTTQIVRSIALQDLENNMKS